MKVNCLFCGNQIFLNHKIFFNDEGAVKCFCCGSMAEIETTEGVLQSACELGVDVALASEKEPS